MKNILSTILFFTSLTALSAQLQDSFLLVGSAGTFSALTDSTFRGTVTFQSDQFGSGYLPTGIQTNYKLIDAKGDIFTITAVNSSNFTTANIDVEEDDADRTAPAGIVMVFKVLDSGLYPLPPVNSTGASPIMQARLLTDNAIMSAANDNRLDSISQSGRTFTFNVGDSTYSMHSIDTFYFVDGSYKIVVGTDTLSASTGFDFGNIWYVTTSGNNSAGIKGDPLSPLADPWAAVDSAVANDIIIVNPGTYTGSGQNLWKDDVTIIFEPGVQISGTSYSETGTISGWFYPQTDNESMTVYGQARFNGNNIISLDSVSGINFRAYCYDHNGINLDAGAKNNKIFVSVINTSSAKSYLLVNAEASGDSTLDNSISMYFDQMNFHDAIVDFNNDNVDKCNRNSVSIYIKNAEVTNAGYDRGYFAEASVSKRFVGWNVLIKIDRGRWEQTSTSFDYNVFGGAYYLNSSRDNQLVVECNSCTTIGAVRPFGDFYYSGFKVYMIGNYFHKAINDSYPAIRYAPVQSSPVDPGIFYYNANIIVENAPAVRVTTGVQQSSVFSGNFKRLDSSSTGVIDIAGGVNASYRLVGKDLVVEVPTGDTAIVGTGGTFYAAGVYDNTVNYGIDPDINYVGLPRYEARTIGEKLAIGNYTIDENTSSLRLDTLNQFVAVTENSQSFYSLGGNIEIRADSGNVVLNGGPTGELKMQGDSLTAPITGAGVSNDGMTGVFVQNDAGETRLTSRLLPQFDTVNVSTANDTIDIDFAFDQTVVVNMNSAPATVDFVVQNPVKGSTLTLVFTSVGSSHTFNFGHTDIQLATKTGWTIDSAAAKVYVLRYNIDGGGDWIIVRDE